MRIIFVKLYKTILQIFIRNEIHGHVLWSDYRIVPYLCSVNRGKSW